MSIEIGREAPDFEGESTKGRIRLSSLKGKKVVLYFFPKAFTSGCTIETKKFAELYEEFRKLNSEVIGVSADSVDTLRRFAEKLGVGFPLVSDSDLRIIRSYGVLSSSGKSASRTTFIIDERGTVRAVLKNLKSADEHATRSLEILRSL